jgi:choline dehydrogenase
MSMAATNDAVAASVGEPAAAVEPEYDYIVVGSGAGGGPVACNLAKAGFRVLLLEAGGDEEPIEYKAPAFHTFASEHKDLSWNFYVDHYSDPVRREGNKKNFVKSKDKNKDKDAAEERHPLFLKDENGILYPRASTLGGCTSHHAMVFIAPHNSDWRYIRDITGDPSWSPWRMRRYFKRLERCRYAAKWPWSRWLNWGRHGFDGWLSTSVADPTLLLRDAVLARVVIAAAQTTYDAYVRSLEAWWDRLATWTSSFFDPNAWGWVKKGSEGLVLPPLTTDAGRRNGTRELIRATMRAQPKNLTVRLHALVKEIVLDADNRATGVKFINGKRIYQAVPQHAAPAAAGDVQEVSARKEVILAGGAFNTPQLLMLSGIGCPQHLAQHGIATKLALPGVGMNLQDRYEVGIAHCMREDLAILKHADFDESDREFEDWRNGYGLYATNGALIALIKRSSHDQIEPDLYMFAVPGYFCGYRPRYSERSRDKNYLTWVILKGHTNNSAGSVSLASRDPCARPTINFRYFDEGSDTGGDDLDAVIAGIDFVRKMTQRTASLMVEEVPGPQCRSRADLASFVKDAAWGHHACGTCKMGPKSDPSAVVDSRFRVHGVQGLRVVDASVFPKIPGLFILSAVYMIAEKASDEIIADAR